MNIEIDKSGIFDEMYRQTALLALKNESNEMIACCEDDAPRVEPLWVAALDELLQLLLPYAKMSLSENSASFLLLLPANWDDAQLDSLQLLATNFVATSLTARWLDSVKPDSAMLLRSLNNSTAMAVKELLFRRKRVKR